jgi:uncharacterized protein YgiM (DUF1202 family)
MNLTSWLAFAAVSSSLLAGRASAQAPASPPAQPPIVVADPLPAAKTNAAPSAKAKAKKTDAAKAAPGKKEKAAPPKVAEEKKAAAPKAPFKSYAAVVTQKNLNVRGQPHINSEIVTRLKYGDRVTVLDEITLSKPQTDEPAHWAKITLPVGTPVWVSAMFVNPDTKAVKPKRLRVRSGPGENYSTIGFITNGTVLSELEAKGDWLKISAPEGSYAFVAAHFLTNAPAAGAIVAVKERPTPPPAPLVETAVVTPQPVVPAVPPQPAPTPAPIQPAPPVVQPQPQPEPTLAKVEPPPLTPRPEPPKLEPVITAPPPPEPIVEEAPPKRIVTREGFVRSTVSIQAPSYFKLEGLENRKTISYVFSPSTNILLRDFFGKRIIATGEEVLDERWPNTPVLNVETIQAVP